MILDLFVSISLYHIFFCPSNLGRRQKGTADDAHLFSFILVMKRLITPDAFDTMKKEIEELNLKYPFVNMKYYGFNDRWKDLL